MIWKRSGEEGRHLTVKGGPRVADNIYEATPYRSPNPVPSVVQACRESREEAGYTRAFFHGGRYVWVNFELDDLDLRSVNPVLALEPLPLRTKRQIRRLFLSPPARAQWPRNPFGTLPTVLGHLCRWQAEEFLLHMDSLEAVIITRDDDITDQQAMYSALDTAGTLYQELNRLYESRRNKLEASSTMAAGSASGDPPARNKYESKSEEAAPYHQFWVVSVEFSNYSSEVFKHKRLCASDQGTAAEKWRMFE